MHDPMTVAWQIKSPFKRKSELFREGFRSSLVTIYHCDPERDGSDDSCGWFKRARHGDPKILEAIRKDFAFHWDADHGGWFDAEGKPLFSPQGITLEMFRVACWVHYLRKRPKMERFLRRHLLDILNFAENTDDSLHPSIVQRYGPVKRDRRIEEFASIVYGCILRWEQPWWRHPRWHVHHWRIQIHALQDFQRWAFSRCAGCGKRFPWGYSPTTHFWNSDGPRWFRGERGVYHSECCPSSAPVASSGNAA